MHSCRVLHQVLALPFSLHHTQIRFLQHLSTHTMLLFRAEPSNSAFQISCLHSGT